ncbi:unnamed protein product [Caenorhabditis brenneri]
MLPLNSVDLTDIHEDDLDLKWEILEQFRLGGGSFADVFHVFYRGHDAVLKRPRKAVAQHCYTVYEREKLRREARIVAALNNCENVVRIYGICESYPFCGMVMEYCAGPNLNELVCQLWESEVEIETIRIFKWCHDLTKTLCELNRTHYHGDVKASNVLVKERPCCCQNGVYKDVTVRDTTYLRCENCYGVHLEHLSLKICDFGMSCEHNTKRRYQGTREFNAPETYDGTYTEKSEVYSFGHLMLVLIIGRPTEQCVDGQKRFLELYNNKKYDLSDCKSNSICETITWCLDKSPEKRPNFKQLLDKLNDRFDHYKSLRGDTDRRSAANIEREEFLEHYKIPRQITMAHRTTTTSTFLSISTNDLSNSQLDLTKEYYGGPFDNEVFVGDSPLASPQISSTKQHEDGYELSRNFVENHLYTGDDEKRIMLLPGGRRRRKESVFRKNSVMRLLVEAKDRISEKIINFIRR